MDHHFDEKRQYTLISYHILLHHLSLSLKYPPLISITLSTHPFSSPFPLHIHTKHICWRNFCRNPQLYTPHEKTIFKSIQLRGKSNNNIYFSSEFTHSLQLQLKIKLKQEKKFIYTHVINSIKLITPHTFTHVLALTFLH